jgi:hypothetical protein
VIVDRERFLERATRPGTPTPPVVGPG